jgi:hypothetical protein
MLPQNKQRLPLQKKLQQPINCTIRYLINKAT